MIEERTLTPQTYHTVQGGQSKSGHTVQGGQSKTYHTVQGGQSKSGHTVQGGQSKSGHTVQGGQSKSGHFCEQKHLYSIEKNTKWLDFTALFTHHNYSPHEEIWRN